MIVIIDYRMGNQGSILNMLRKIRKDGIISSKISDIEKADKLILPGVGAFDYGMKNLSDLKLIPILNDKVVRNKTPILGICLGMQLLTKKSEEGKLSGLGWIDAETVKFRFDQIKNDLKVPHMGWNNIKVIKPNPLFEGLEEKSKFYFVHSFHVKCNNDEDIVAKTLYGQEFISSIQKENIFGVQFHPEKSHKFGLTLLKYFVDY